MTQMIETAALSTPLLTLMMLDGILS